MNEIIKIKIALIVNHFQFTKEDIDEFDFAKYAEEMAEINDSNYDIYYTLCDEISYTYHVNDVNAKINELITEFLNTQK